MILAMTIAAALGVQNSGEPQSAAPQPPRRAYGALNQYFSADDYPESALIRRAEGTVGFSLEIDAQGAVSRCTVTHSSNDPALDAQTCAILLGRVRYMPARDGRGRAIAGSDQGRVTWRLPPAPPPPPFRARRVVNVLRSDGAGSLTCTVMDNGVAVSDVAPGRCGMLSMSGTEHALRQVETPTEVTMILASGPASADIDRVGSDEAGFGVLQYDVVEDLDIAPDGRIAGCQLRRRSVAATPVAVAPNLCEPVPPDARPMFEPSPEPGLRRARYRVAVYIKGTGLTPQQPATASAPPRRP